LNVRPSFDRIARPYRWLEYLTLGRALERCRFHYLPRLLQQRRALVLGDGDGRFLVELLRQNPGLCADAVDSSAVMLQLLRGLCEDAGLDVAERLRTHHLSALEFTPAVEEGYDLVVTHFFLDCFMQAELEILMERIAPALAPEALWVVSDFRIPEGAMRMPARVLVRGLYFAFRVLTGLRVTRLPDHRALLKEAGFERSSFHYGSGGVLTSELWRRL
jgi:Methyltransferase domain